MDTASSRGMARQTFQQEDGLFITEQRFRRRVGSATHEKHNPVAFGFNNRSLACS